MLAATDFCVGKPKIRIGLTSAVTNCFTAFKLFYDNRKAPHHAELFLSRLTVSPIPDENKTPVRNRACSSAIQSPFYPDSRAYCFSGNAGSDDKP